MELIAKDLKYQRELMRLFEPVVGLQIVTDDNHVRASVSLWRIFLKLIG